MKLKITNLNEAVDEIEQLFINDMKKRKSEFEAEGTEEIQNAAKFLKVYDTGNLASRSKMTQFAFDNHVIWRFWTVDVDYDVYPRNGLGSSRAYGPRKYDLRALIKTAKSNGLKMSGATLSDTGRARSKAAKNKRTKTITTLKKSGYSDMQSLRIARKISQRKYGIKAYEGVPNRGKK